VIDVAVYRGYTAFKKSAQEGNNMKLIRPNEIQGKASISAGTAYRLEKAGQFPARRRISPRCVGWLESELDQWIADRTVVVPVRDLTKIGKGRPGPGRPRKQPAQAA
jgi:prophage regulatory protein